MNLDSTTNVLVNSCLLSCDIKALFNMVLAVDPVVGQLGLIVRMCECERPFIRHAKNFTFLTSFWNVLNYLFCHKQLLLEVFDNAPQ